MDSNKVLSSFPISLDLGLELRRGEGEIPFSQTILSFQLSLTLGRGKGLGRVGGGQEVLLWALFLQGVRWRRSNW